MRSTLLQSAHAPAVRRAAAKPRHVVPKTIEFSREDNLQAPSPRSRAVQLMSGVAPSAEPEDLAVAETVLKRTPAERAPPSPRRLFSLKEVSHGCWYDLHLLAANGERGALEALLATFSRRFICVKCRLHIRAYVAEHPRPKACERARPKESAFKLFKWTVDFHNSVTKRIYEETHSPTRATLNDVGALALFHELTDRADEDEIRHAAGGECDGPGSPCAGATRPPHAAPIETVTTTRWVAS